MQCLAKRKINEGIEDFVWNKKALQRITVGLK
ncbi:hypothetical protein DI53_0862 [Sphingobacterium deserti]|uniref:Uncharacterized protein n=1 Tax=Sphingobacterium deserti TaxID=1229276 RepID=A0A0B8TB60_9SPHI|nr:hypothetical protein DI53_0862 [Sphingobacterium deserti]